jgi:uncharacterized protein (TIGR03000 family)
MIRGVFSSLGLAAVSLSGLLVLADSATAQRREGGEARREGRENLREGRYQGGRYDGGYFGDRGYSGDRGYLGYDRGYWGGGYGPYWGGGYGRGFYRPNYGYSYGPRYYDSGFYGDGYVDGDGYATSYDDGYYDSGRRRFFGRRGRRRNRDYSYGSAPMYGDCRGYGTADSAIANGAANASPDRALITVKVAPDAEILFDDFKTTQTGSDRQFITPPLEGNHDFTYQVHVRSNGGEQTKKITVHPGDQLTLDLTQAAAAGERAESQGESIKAPRRSEKYGSKARDDKGTERRNAQEARSDENRSGGSKTHQGQVVRVSGQELVMKGADGKEHTHTLAKDAKVTIDGKSAKAEDLKPDMKIEVTTAEGDMKTALQVEAKSSK